MNNDKPDGVSMDVEQTEHGKLLKSVWRIHHG